MSDHASDGNENPFPKLGAATIALIERACGMPIGQIRARPLAETWKEIHSRPGPKLSEVFPKYKKAWAEAHGLGLMLIYNLCRDLNMTAGQIMDLRADFLSKEGDHVDSDGFWLLIQKLVRSSDPKIGIKYQPFWKAVFPPWKGYARHIGPAVVQRSEVTRLNFELTMAVLAAKPLP